MKPISLLPTLLVLAAAMSAHAWHSVDYFQTGENPFSKQFTAEYHSALAEPSSGNPLAILTNMLMTYKAPAEQAELELTMAHIYSYRAGSVDFAKAVECFTHGLRFDLPPTILVDVYYRRGGCYETLKQRDAALQDYVTGLAICLLYDLPTAMPTAPMFPMYDVAGPPDSAFLKYYHELNKRNGQRHKKYRFETEMLRTQGFLIESAKRISNSDASQIRKLAQSLASEPRAVEDLVRLVTSPLPSPPTEHEPPAPKPTWSPGRIEWEEVNTNR